MKDKIDYINNIQQIVEQIECVRRQISTVIVGQGEVIDLCLIALLCEGHILLEGVPGLGKTLLVRTLADSLNLRFARVQFTPDLMPADIIGTSIAAQNERGDFDLRFEAGPLFANLVLGDEINRASPKTQAALLEAMQEQVVTVRGIRYPLPRPFLVMATQNPLEMEGTYPLPEAQIDRFFFKILVEYPSERELETIIERTVGTSVVEMKAILAAADLQTMQQAVREIVVPPHILNYAVRLTLATQPNQEFTLPKLQQYVRYGAGPRGAQALVLAAKAKALLSKRFNVCLEDIRQMAYAALRHRMALNFDGQSEGVTVDELIKEIITYLPTDVARPDAIKNR